MRAEPKNKFIVANYAIFIHVMRFIYVCVIFSHITYMYMYITCAYMYITYAYMYVTNSGG